MNTEASLWQRSRQAAYAEITSTFFRYFGTKEDIVLGDLAKQGEFMRDALEKVPLAVEPWDALRQALHAVDALVIEPGVTLKIARMMYGTPSLRSRSIEKHLHWQSLILPNIRRRLGLAEDDTSNPAPAAIVASAIACLDVAGELWTSGDGTGDLAEFYDRAVAAVRSGS
jgi:AcrR family transcriptional regulator